MNSKLDIILAEISIGELIDKITILEIKKEKITDSEIFQMMMIIRYQKIELAELQKSDSP